jgi:hypothetical protein
MVRRLEWQSAYAGRGLGFYKPAMAAQAGHRYRIKNSLICAGRHSRCFNRNSRQSRQVDVPANHDRRNARDEQQCAAENDDTEQPFSIGGAIRRRVSIVLPRAESGYHSLEMLTARKPQQISTTFGNQIGRTNSCEPFPKTWKAPVTCHGRSPMQPARISRALKISFRHHLRL